MDNETYYNENLHISSESARLLSNIAGWTRFLSILAFALIIIFALAIIGGATLVTSVNYFEMSRGYTPYVPGNISWAYIIFYVLMLVIYAIPVFYLFKFSTKIKNALKTGSTNVLTDAIRYLKMHYTFIGVLTVVWLVMFVITFIMVGLGILGTNM